jgi:hypothetical protein
LNVQISTFNSKQLVENERILLTGDVDPSNKASTGNLSEHLKSTATELLDEARAYDNALSELLEGAAKNRNSLSEAYEVSMENRDLIIKNRDSLTSQQASVLAAIAKTESRS